MKVYEFTYTRRRVAEVADSIRTPEDCAELVRQLLNDGNLAQEHLVVVALNTKNMPIGTQTVYVGSLGGAAVRVAEVLRMPIVENAASMIVAHNHPSGDPAPSGEDIRITGELAEASKLFDIELLDHIIIGEWPRYVSLRRHGVLYRPEVRS